MLCMGKFAPCMLVRAQRTRKTQPDGPAYTTIPAVDNKARRDGDRRGPGVHVRGPLREKSCACHVGQGTKNAQKLTPPAPALTPQFPTTGATSEAGVVGSMAATECLTRLRETPWATFAMLVHKKAREINSSADAIDADARDQFPAVGELVKVVQKFTRSILTALSMSSGCNIGPVEAVHALWQLEVEESMEHEGIMDPQLVASIKEKCKKQAEGYAGVPTSMPMHRALIDMGAGAAMINAMWDPYLGRFPTQQSPAPAHPGFGAGFAGLAGFAGKKGSKFGRKQFQAQARSGPGAGAYAPCNLCGKTNHTPENCWSAPGRKPPGGAPCPDPGATPAGRGG